MTSEKNIEESQASSLKSLILLMVNHTLPSLIKVINQIICELNTVTKEELKTSGQNYTDTFKEGKYNWSYMYLRPDLIYPDFKPFIASVVEEQIMNLKPEKFVGISSGEIINQALDEIISDIENAELIYNEFKNVSEGEDEEERQFMEMMVARFFDNLAYADYKQSMTGLLYGLLKEKKNKNLKKLVSIDPSIAYLPEIQTYIEASSPRNKGILWGYIDEGLNNKFLNNNKNIYPPIIFILISLFDNMGAFEEPIKLGIDDVYQIIDVHGLNYVEDNPDLFLEKAYFKKIYEQYQETKVKESTINFDFLTT